MFSGELRRRLATCVGTICIAAALVLGLQPFAVSSVSVEELLASRLGIELRLESACDTDLELDAPRLERILAHLIDNALRYTPIGRVTVRSALEDQRLQISVTDTGKGIRGEELESIFRPYVRGRDEETESAGGGARGSRAPRDSRRSGCGREALGRVRTAQTRRRMTRRLRGHDAPNRSRNTSGDS